MLLQFGFFLLSQVVPLFISCEKVGTVCDRVYSTGHSTSVSQSLSSYQEQTADSELLKDTKSFTTELKDPSASFGNVKKIGPGQPVMIF